MQSAWVSCKTMLLILILYLGLIITKMDDQLDNVAMAIQNFKMSELDNKNYDHMEHVKIKTMLFEFLKSID